MDFFGIGTGELLFILFIMLLIFGPRKVPEMARQIGKTMNTLKKSTNELTTAVTREIELEKQKLAETAREATDGIKEASQVNTAKLSTPTDSPPIETQPTQPGQPAPR